MITPDKSAAKERLSPGVHALLLCVAAIAGVVVGWYTISWAVFAIRVPLNVPEQSPIPMSDRGPNAQGPPLSYWMSWLIPIATVLIVGLAVARWSRRLRWFAVWFLAGFCGPVLAIAPIWISIDAYGFSPS